MAKERSGNGGKDNGNGNDVVTSSTKVKPDWKKRVRFEYKRLREQRKFRYQEDIKVAWRKNRAKMETKFSTEEPKSVPSDPSNVEPSTKVTDVEPCTIKKETGKTLSKPIWVCSE